MAKELKKFSWHPQYGQHKGTNLYILATSQKQAVEILNEVGVNINAQNLSTYGYKAWGNDGEEMLKDVDKTQTK